MQVISCKDARALGLKRYFTGKPCKHGHVDERHVSGGCVVCANLDQQRYYAKNPEKYKAWTVAYRQDNPDKVRKIQRDYYSRNAHVIKAGAKTQRGARALRVPPWSETDAIAEFYKDCPEGYEVDHFYPLQGATVSGLHVLGNLQYLLMSDNRSKKNKVPE